MRAWRLRLDDGQVARPYKEFEMDLLPLLPQFLRAWPNQGSESTPDPPDRPSIRAVSVEGPDGEAVHRLAELSGREPPTGAVLLAELAGSPVAAIGIFDGSVIADRARLDMRLRLRLQVDRLFALAVIAVIGV